MQHKQFRDLLRRWHRRLGLVAALFLIWISISGVLLNHTNWFDLAEIPLPTSVAGALYELESSTQYEIETPIGLILQSKQKIFLNGTLLGQCEGQLRGLIELSNQRWIACDLQLLILNTENQVVEIIDQYYGLPSPVTAIGQCSDSVCIESSQKAYQFIDASGAWDVYQGNVNWFSGVKETQDSESVIPEIHNWERFILEAHSGRLFGRFGVFFMDLIAIIAIILSLSGWYMWWVHYRRQKQRVDK